MKTKMYTLLLLILISTGLSAAPRTLITATSNNGNWSSTGTWSLNRIPANNDSVYIPAGITVNVDNSYTLDNLFITIGGTLNFNQNKTLALDVNSAVNILSGGTLTAAHPTPNELLTIGGVTKYEGKTDVSISGPVEATSMTGPSPSGFSMVTLPVSFVSFTANRSNGAVQLIWNTTNAIDNSHFEVERSADGSTWETIGNLDAIASSSEDTYTFTDESVPAAQTEYRICEVDMNGNYMYSTVVMVGSIETATAQATIAASGKTVAILLQNATGNRLFVRVMTIGGQVLQQQSFESTSNRFDLNLATSAAGIYVVQVTDGSQWSIAKEVML